MDRETLLAHGIEPEYTDIWGRTHEVSDETAAMVLQSLDSAGATSGSTLVTREDTTTLDIRIPIDRVNESLKLEIEWEGGELQHRWFWLPELRKISSDDQSITTQIPLPPLRLGYHRLRLYWMREPELQRFADSRFIVCPQRAKMPDRRMAGVALSLYGLRSRRNWGIGDFTDLIAAIDVFAKAGVQFIALNPLHAIPNREPYNTSPYLPTCSLYRNFIYLDVEKVVSGLQQESGMEMLRAREFVEYEGIADLKREILRDAFRDFAAAGGSPEFNRYIEQEGAALNDFAIYCALDEAMHFKNPDVWLWRDWPAEYQDPRSPHVMQFAQEHRDDVLFFKFLQWHVDRQLAEAQAHALATGMRIGLYHDLALATDRFGADLWANRALYANGARVGAPPDDFSPKGQDWAFPPPNREAHRANGYEWFAQSIRNNARHGGALRIDHVMRFFRLYWIPDGTDATNGAYVRDDSEDLLGILALESVRGNFIVIGEDLGTVTDQVRRSLHHTGVLSYRVLWFERHGDGSFKSPHEYPELAAVSTSTHDLPTLAGFAEGRDIVVRREAGLINESEAEARIYERQKDKHLLAEALRRAGFENDPIGFLLSTPALLAVINQEDLTGEVDQQNLPGTTTEHHNWRRKMRLAVEDLGPLADHLREQIIFSKR